MSVDGGEPRAPLPFALLLKSYGPDLAYAQRLVDSFRRHNVDSLHLFVLVPDADVPDFRALAGADVTVMSESALASRLTLEPINGWAPGYMNQQIVKLAFWELGLANNYLCMDSDAVFVRDFGRSDFMVDADVPFTFLTRDAELRSDPRYWQEHWQARDARLTVIRELLELDTSTYLTCHQHAVFSATVLRGLVERFLEPRGWDYRDLLGASPYEFSWYNFWLEKDRTIPLHVREPIFKTFHTPDQHVAYAVRGIGLDDIARGYVGVVLNTNFSRGAGVLAVDDALPDTLAAYVPTATLLSAAARRLLPGRRG